MSFTWNIPTKVLFGPGRLGDLHKEAPLGKKALVVISNGKSAKTNGSLDKLKKELELWNAEYVVFDKIQANPLEPTIMEGVLFGREHHCDFVVALGGGSVMDSATVISAMIPQREGRVWDYVQLGSGGKKPLTEKPLPYVDITTSTGTGSEVDAGGVVTNPDTNEKTGFFGAFPTIAVVDPELMLTVPQKFTAYQGFDAFFHNAEGYISTGCNEAAAMVELTAIQNSPNICRWPWRTARTSKPAPKLLSPIPLAVFRWILAHVPANTAWNTHFPLITKLFRMERVLS